MRNAGSKNVCLRRPKYVNHGICRAMHGFVSNHKKAYTPYMTTFTKAMSYLKTFNLQPQDFKALYELNWTELALKRLS